jgi:thiosulfate reductase cytochrome b subunit
MSEDRASAIAPRPGTDRRSIYRHSIAVRLTHWVNVLCLTLLLMSGLQIFNAHPALYWGDQSDFEHPILAMTAADAPDGSALGVTTVFGHSIPTTGLLGLSFTDTGRPIERGFPSWATIPSYQDLAAGRLWHFFWAWLFVLNGLVYLGFALATRHVSRDLAPTGQDLRHIGRSIWDHARLRFPRGKEAERYNVLQKLSYLAVIFVLLPLIVVAGLTMSPQIDAAYPILLEIFGGRQSARTVHFVAAWLLVAFVLVHLIMVLISGVWNNLRSMVTGRYVIEEARDGE